MKFKYRKKSDKIKEIYDKVSDKKKITFFTGAGISKESGIETYRDSDGLWNKFKIEDVATAKSIKKDFSKVINFFNTLRSEILQKEPNIAHHLIKSLEEDYEVLVVTQNIDNLHEKANSSNIIHLHGEIFKSRPVANTKIIYDQYQDIKEDERCPATNSALRPNVTLFGEDLNEIKYNNARKHIRESDFVVVIGTSLIVQPAMYLVAEGNSKSKLFFINPDFAISLEYYNNFYKEVTHIREVATIGMDIFINMLNSEK